MPVSPTLAALLSGGLTRDLNAPASSDLEGTLTYGELGAVAEGVRAALVELGAGAGADVAVLLPLCRWVPAVMVGVLASGAAYVPIDLRLPEARRDLICQSAGAEFQVRVVGGGLIVMGSLGQRMVPTSPSAPGTLVWAEKGTRDEAVAYTMFTSGSSGTPKGVRISRGALAWSTSVRVSYYGQVVGKTPTLLLCSSISFDTSVASIYWALATGGHLVVPSAIPGHPSAIRAACQRYAANAVLLLPGIADLLVRDDACSELDSLRAVVCCGEAVSNSTVERLANRLPAAAIFNEYGPTEGTVWCTAHRCQPGENPVPIGRPIPGYLVALISPGSHQQQPVEAPAAGELWISGPGLSLGYLGGGESSFPHWRGRRWYATGDLVRRDGDLLVYAGRKDFQLKLKGVRIEPEEVERVLRTAADGKPSAVGIGNQDDGHPPELVGFIECDGAVSRDQALAIRTAMLRQLPAAAVPRAIVALPELPVGERGKLDRLALTELANGALRAWTKGVADRPTRTVAARTEHRCEPSTSE